jgi:hypothetical protein
MTVEIDAVCEQCGHPYPWTTREEVVDMLRELIALDQLSPADGEVALSTSRSWHSPTMRSVNRSG